VTSISDSDSGRGNDREEHLAFVVEPASGTATAFDATVRAVDGGGPIEAPVVAEATITLTARIYERTEEGNQLVVVTNEQGEHLAVAVVPTSAKIGVVLTQVIKELGN
jgi:hypothetical protein